MTLQEKKHIKKLLRENKVKEALEYLHTLSLTENQQSILIGLEARFKEMVEKKMASMLTAEQVSTERHIIIQKILDLLKEEENPPISPIKTPLSFWKSKTFLWISLIGSLASIIGIGFYFYPPEPTFTQLTIFVVDKDNNPILQNKAVLSVPIKNEMKPKTLNNEGRVNFDEVALQKGDSVKIGFKAKGWEIIRGQRNFEFNGEPITLQVQRAISTRIIKGRVEKHNRAPLDKVQVLVASDRVFYTNILGVFRDTLPIDLQLPQDSSTYTLKFSKSGYETTTRKYPINAKDFVITLNPSKNPQK